MYFILCTINVGIIDGDCGDGDGGVGFTRVQQCIFFSDIVLAMYLLVMRSNWVTKRILVSYQDITMIKHYRGTPFLSMSSQLHFMIRSQLGAGVPVLQHATY